MCARARAHPRAQPQQFPQLNKLPKFRNKKPNRFTGDNLIGVVLLVVFNIEIYHEINDEM
jgi:hypothetical protein